MEETTQLPDTTIVSTEITPKEEKKPEPLAKKGELVPLRVLGGKRWYTVTTVTLDGVAFTGNSYGIEEENYSFTWKGYDWVVKAVDDDGFLAVPFQRTLSNDRRRGINRRRYTRRGRISHT